MINYLISTRIVQSQQADTIARAPTSFVLRANKDTNRMAIIRELAPLVTCDCRNEEWAVISVSVLNLYNTSNLLRDRDMGEKVRPM